MFGVIIFNAIFFVATNVLFFILRKNFVFEYDCTVKNVKIYPCYFSKNCHQTTYLLSNGKECELISYSYPEMDLSNTCVYLSLTEECDYKDASNLKYQFMLIILVILMTFSIILSLRRK